MINNLYLEFYYSICPHRNFILLKKISVFTSFLSNYTPEIPMSKYEPTIAEVLTDSRLIDIKTAKLPTNSRINAKGIVLRQRVGFSKGNYLTLRNLKKFYKPLNEGKSPSYSLIIRRELDLLDNRISSIRNTKDLYEDSEVFNVLASRGKWGRSSK